MKTSYTYTGLALALLCAVSLLSFPALIADRHMPARVSKAQSDQPPIESSTARLTSEQTREAYGQIEMGFEPSSEQTGSGVNFLARGAGYTLFLKPTEAVFVLARHEGRGKTQITTEQSSAEQIVQTGSRKRDASGTTFNEPSKVLRMKLVGADKTAAVKGADELPGKVNYFIGNDPAKWRANVPTFGRVRYREVYPGIDVVYYGNQRQLEYDFVVAPGKDARAVKLKFDGADNVEVDAAGDLLLTLGETVVRQPKPVVYQDLAGARHDVNGAYTVDVRGQVGFSVGDYDHSAPLIIDPVLVYSTYLGGSSTDLARAIAVDSSGNAYITGYTRSTNFPTANAFQGTLNGFQNVFVTKINAAGTAFAYSTYLGGSDLEEARGIAVDTSGNAYVVGYTTSTNFPVVNAIQGTLGSNGQDAFVTKINAAGSALVYSTYLGGSQSSEFGEAIAVDSSGNAYVTGSTFSNDFPTANAIQGTFGGFTDAFVSKINAAGTALVYSTYLGGSGSETGFGIAVDPSGNAYVTGETASTNFPLANAIQGTYGGGSSDAFVTKINAAGSAFVYSTYLGGSDQDRGEGIKADASGNAYLAGFTLSIDFPVANAFQATNGGTTVTQDAFVTKINTAGSAFVYSTYFGGTGGEIATGIAIDSSGSAYIVGSTSSLTSLPVLNAIQCTRNGSQDLFITKFNAAGSALVYSTYLGGSGSDDGQSIAVDSSNNAYVTGSTTSTDYPTVNPIQGTSGGGFPFGDAFVTKLNDAVGPTACATPTPTPPAIGKSFNPASIPLGNTTTLSFTITNSNTSTTLTGVGFSDTLPEGLSIADSSTTQCGGTLTTTAATRTISLSGATVAPGVPCTFNVTVTGSTDGNYTNTTGNVTSSNGGTGNTASANLTVVSAPVISKSFNPASIPQGSTSTLTFTITNPNTTTTLNGVGFSDTLPAGLDVADSTSPTCSGTLTTTAATRTISLSGASVAPGVPCTFNVIVTGTTAGVYTNTTGNVSSSNGGTGNTATAGITVVSPLAISKGFSPTSIAQGSTTTLSFTINNTNTTTTLTGVGFTDVLPAGLDVANSSTPTCSGTLTTTAATRTISLSGASVAPGVPCTFNRTVAGTTAGVYTNTTGNVTSTNGGTGNTASAPITVVGPPAISKSFNPASIPQGTTTTLSFTITNSNTSTTLNGVAFSDVLPAGLSIVNSSTTPCSGTLTTTAATRTILLSGASVAPGVPCTFNVTVTGLTEGSYPNTTGNVTSSNGGTGNTASANLTVVSAPVISKSFNPASIPQGTTTTLSFTITNSNTSTTLNGVGFSDTLPVGLSIVDSSTTRCSGTLTTTAATRRILLSGASVAPGVPCTFNVTVTGLTEGSYPNTTGNITSSNGGTGNTATANLTVVVDNLPPILLTFAGTDRAIAIDSVTFVIEPFSLPTDQNFTADHRTRIMLFALHVQLRPGENASAVTAEADVSGTVVPLTVESVRVVPGFEFLTQVVVKFPDGFSTGGGGPHDAKIRITLRVQSSNQAIIIIVPAPKP